jgi:hypothetical protein
MTNPVAKGVVIRHDASRLLDDVGFAAESGVQRVRLDVPWALASPREGVVDGGVLESVRLAAMAARDAGVEPWFRLLQYDVPRWFENEGGFSDRKTAATHWPRWVQEVADSLGDVAGGWVPFEAPGAMADRLEPDDLKRHGELAQHLFVAWRDAWRILRGGPPVATSLDRPALALWLPSLVDGMVRVPGRVERRLTDLAGACDVIGVALRERIASTLAMVRDVGGGRPTALTYRPVGTTETERSESMATTWRECVRDADDTGLTAVWVTPFVEAPGQPGLCTSGHRLTDTGAAFLEGAQPFER